MIKRLFACFCSLLIFAALSFVPDDADAARIGGGRSFGGRPGMSTPYQKPLPSPSSPTMRQQASQSAQPGAAAAAPNRGLFGGMGGMLGGLLAGGLLGSLLFGGGMGGMGGLLDIILIGALIYFGIKFLARRRAARNMQENGAGLGMVGQPAGQAGDFGQMDYRGQQPINEPLRRADTPSATGFGWDALASQPSGTNAIPGTPSAEAAPQRNLPPDFDEEEFLRGARAAYTRLNAAWDRRDLDDIAQFSTPAFLDEIRRQKEGDPTPGRTEILLVNASVVEGRSEGSDQIVSVYFDVLLREHPGQEVPTDVREVWHFVRPIAGGNWKLDGIQQVERA